MYFWNETEWRRILVWASPIWTWSWSTHWMRNYYWSRDTTNLSLWRHWYRHYDVIDLVIMTSLILSLWRIDIVIMTSLILCLLPSCNSSVDVDDSKRNKSWSEWPLLNCSDEYPWNSAEVRTRVNVGHLHPLIMADDNVWTMEMADDNVRTMEMADENVWTREMTDDNVWTLELSDDNVWNLELADDIVWTGGIQQKKTGIDITNYYITYTIHEPRWMIIRWYNDLFCIQTVKIMTVQPTYNLHTYWLNEIKKHRRIWIGLCTVKLSYNGHSK